MKRTKQLLAAVSSVALVALSTAPAYAAGTTAGDTITNTVFVDYQVGGFDQTQETDTDVITVDRKIDLTVAETGLIGRTDVSPNQTQAIIQYEVTNLSNDVADFALTAVNASGNPAPLTNIKIYSDANGNGIIDGADAEITFLDEVAVDAAGARQVIVTADIPITATAGQNYDVVLTATAHAGGGAATLGAVHTNTAGANTEDGTGAAANIDTVLADIATSVGGVTDVASDGIYSAIDGYTIVAADVAVAKSSTIVEDPINGTTNPKAIPGATVEYCIVVSNTGAATATGVNVLDELPDDVTFVASSIFINGADDCTGGAAGGTFTAGTPNEVSGTLNDIATGVSLSLYFQATIN